MPSVTAQELGELWHELRRGGFSLCAARGAARCAAASLLRSHPRPQAG